jgi:hypothetical protein
MARLLTSAGLMCGHESIFTPEGLKGAISRLMGDKKVDTSWVSLGKDQWFNPATQVAESSYLAAPFLDQFDYPIIHVVRNPIKVISSTYLDADFFKDKLQIPYRQFVYNHLPELEKISNEIERTAAYYIWWNKLVERKSVGKKYIRLQVENAISPKLFDFLGVQQPEKLFGNTSINSWKGERRDLRLSDVPDGIIKDEFISIIERYGYELLYITL